MAGENIYSTIQLSADRWLDIFEVLCISAESAEGEKRKRLEFLKKVVRDNNLRMIQRNIPVEEEIV